MQGNVPEAGFIMSCSKRRFIQAGGILAMNLMTYGCGGSQLVSDEDPSVRSDTTDLKTRGETGLAKAFNHAGVANLALLSDAVLSGSVAGARGTPRDILFDPLADGYAASTDWNEYGVPYDQDLGLATEAQGFWWQVTWAAPKTVNTISFGGSYPNQPQPNTRWKIETLSAGAWTVLIQGQGGWLDQGILGWGGTSQQPITVEAIRLKAWSDGMHPLTSIHLRGRGGRSFQNDDSTQPHKATAVQYLPPQAGNLPSRQNLALLPDAAASGSVTGGRGAPRDILFDPATNAYVTQTEWNEYGVPFNQSLGLVDEANAFYWQVAWAMPKFVNRVCIGGAYSNQPQRTTRWKVELALNGVWTKLSEGQGGWLDSGEFVWGGADQTPRTADALRVKAWSDGVHPVVSIHLRGRGGKSLVTDDREHAQKAALIQYLPRSSAVNVLFDTDIGPDCDDVGTLALMHALADLGEANLLGVGVTVSNPWSAPTVDAINTWYKRPALPVATLKENGFLTDSPYTERVAKNFPHNLQSGLDAPDALSMYRRVLAAEPDSSVTLVAVGPLRNMSRLLRSPADVITGLTGSELIALKVKTLVVMGCAFPAGREWNIEQDPASAQLVVNEWPTTIVFSGVEIGNDIHTGYSMTSQTPTANPARMAYEIHVGANQNRPSWDQTAMLYAVRGAADGLFSLSTPGTVSITNNGDNTFAPSSGGRHRYLIKQKSNAEIAAVIEALMIRAPR